MAIHALAQAVLALLRDEARHVELPDEIIQVVVRLEDHAAAAPTIAAVRPALGAVSLAAESDTTPTAVSGARHYFDLVNEHERRKKLVSQP